MFKNIINVKKWLVTILIYVYFRKTLKGILIPILF
jgi:hypothetical protein